MNNNELDKFHSKIAYVNLNWRKKKKKKKYQDKRADEFFGPWVLAFALLTTTPFYVN